MKRALVIQTAYLGDVVLTTPLLREVRRAHPEHRVTVLTTPLGAEVLAGSPFADEIRVYDKRAGLYGLRGLARAIRALRADGDYDLGIAAHRSYRSGFLIGLGGVRTRIGFAGASGAWAYSARVPWDGTVHAVDRYLALAGPAGGDPAGADRTPFLAVGEDDRRNARARRDAAGVPGNRPLACLAPGSQWAGKRWLPESFAAVGRRLREDGFAVAVVGAAAERDLCETVREGVGGDARALAGTLSVRELIGTLADARIVIANDSGPAHVAAAVGTSVVAVFGPTTPALGFAPVGRDVRIVEHPDLDCRPCDRHGPRRCPLGHFRCMREVGPDAVLHAIDRSLDAATGT